MDEFIQIGFLIDSVSTLHFLEGIRKHKRDGLNSHIFYNSEMLCTAVVDLGNHGCFKEKLVQRECPIILANDFDIEDCSWGRKSTYS